MFLKTLFHLKKNNTFGQRWSCSLLCVLWPAWWWCGKSEKFVSSSITPSAHLICRYFPFYFVWNFLVLWTMILMRQRSGRIPEGSELNPCQMILDLQCSSQNAKDRSEQGGKLSPALLLISGWKRYFYQLKKNQKQKGERFESSYFPMISWCIFFLTWKFFNRTVETFCDERGNTKWSENEVQSTKNSTTTWMTQRPDRQSIPHLKWIKLTSKSFWVHATYSRQWKRRKINEWKLGLKFASNYLRKH